jgi:hypothetical protein
MDSNDSSCGVTGCYGYITVIMTRIICSICHWVFHSAIAVLNTKKENSEPFSHDGRTGVFPAKTGEKKN